MPRSALASCPGRVPAYAHPTTRSYKGHTPLAAISIRPQEIAQVTSEGAGDSLVLGLGLVDQAVGQPLVLVVDDEPDLCANLWDLLRERGYRVGVVHDERTAAERLT